MNPDKLASRQGTKELIKLGNDIAIARKLRKFTQQRLAEGAGANVATVRRLERGDAGVSLGVLVMVLLTLGEEGRLGNLMDVSRDDIGLVIRTNDLPKRVRSKRSMHSAKPEADADRTTDHGSVLSEPEAF